MKTSNGILTLMLGLLSTSICSTLASAQCDIDTVWTKCFGGTNGEIANDVEVTPYNEYVIAGYSKSNDGDVSGHHGSAGVADAWIIKLNSNGKLIWKKSFGGTGIDFANAVQIDGDGNYVVVGATESTNGDVHNKATSDSDIWVIKLDTAGDTLWERVYAGAHGYNDDALDVKETVDGNGYVIAGFTEINPTVQCTTGGDASTDKDFWIIKINKSNGNLISGQSHTYGGEDPPLHGPPGTTGRTPYEDFAGSIVPVSDGYVVSGPCRSNEDKCDGDLLLLKLHTDLSQDSFWVKDYGAWNGEGPYTTLPTADDGFISIGVTHSYASPACNKHCYSCPTCTLEDNYNNSAIDPLYHGEDHEMWVVKTNSDGSLDNNFNSGSKPGMKTYGGTLEDNGYSIVSACDDGYFLVGSSKSTDGDATNSGHHNSTDSLDLFIVKIAGDATFEGACSLGGSNDDVGNSIKEVSSHTYIVAGYTKTHNNGDVHGQHGNNKPDFWIVKFTDNITCSTKQSILEKNVYSSIACIVIPNPAFDYVTITLSQIGTVHLKILNEVGKVVVTDNWSQENEQQTQSIDIVKLPAGHYIVECEINGQVARGKFLVAR